MIKHAICSIFAVGAALTLAASPASAQSAKAAMKDADGNDVGVVELMQTPHGVLLTARLNGIPAGVHAFHVHAVGQCEPPFTSAEGHFNPEEKKHGLLSEDGHHAGDMPNIHVPEGGALTIEIMNEEISLERDEDESVFDDDGSAIVIHGGADDYKSDPAGDAGPRIACGVIE